LLSIKKAIPVAGGLAGGSADAAAALLACAVLWDLDVGSDELTPLAAELGSDVPFALLGGTALGSGRGEHVVPVLARGGYHWVLAFGHHGLSTPAVYRRHDELGARKAGLRGRGGPAFEVPPALMNALRSGDPVALGAALVNDLQPAALDLQPRLRQVLEAGLEHGAVGALVSGSGPTCAFLAANEAAAVDLSVALSADGQCRAVRRATGPVTGARVIG
jgi:4-diphosphocytidyl-2-C-methyl-D-erythritol kinase